MTRKDQLFAMNGATLIMLADKLGVKIKCNRTRTSLKEAKQAVIERILAAENASAEQVAPDNQENNPEEEKQEKPAEPSRPEKPEANKEENKPSNTLKKSGRNAQLEFNGRAQNICAWAKELGISANTLYGRIYKMGWSVEKAFTTPSSRQAKQADKPRA